MIRRAIDPDQVADLFQHLADLVQADPQFAGDRGREIVARLDAIRADVVAVAVAGRPPSGARMSLKRRYTIERISSPSSIARYLTVFDDGTLRWGGGLLPFCIFDTARKAELFRRFRMGEHSGDAHVVAHAIH